MIRTWKRGLMLFMGGVVSAIIPNPAASARTSECSGTGPLVSKNWEKLDLASPGHPAGEWKLPVGPDQPENVTEAQLRLEVTKNLEKGTWKANLYFSFGFPKV